MKSAIFSARCITAVLVATLLSLLAAATVSAALFLILAPESGPPGTEVTGRTGGEGALPSAVGPLPTYLVGEADLDGITSPGDPALVDIGQLLVDAEGNGSIRFVVPELDPGSYVVVVYCPACAAFSGGSVMAPVATFEVIPQGSDTAMRDRSAFAAVLTALGGLLLFGAILVAIRRQRPSA